jgi:signal transduction histidine kinase
LTWTSRRAIPILLAAATLVPIGALGWLAARILRQDRDLEAQHASEALRYAAGKLSLAVSGKLAGIEEQLAQGRGIRFEADGWKAAGDSALLYQPAPARSAEPPAAVFAPAEALEFERHDLGGAVREYERQAQAQDRSLRAAALVRLGAVLRKRGDTVQALDAYTRLQRLGSVLVEDQPAELIARQGRARIFEKAGDAARLHEEAARLARVLYGAGEPIDRATFALYSEMLRNWGGPPPPAEEVARTEAAIALWKQWRTGEMGASGRKIVSGVLAVWSGGPEHPVVWLAAPATLESAFSPLWKQEKLSAALYDPEGQRLAGPDLPDAVALTPGETHLPFILRVAYAPGHRNQSDDRQRRTLLLAGLGLTFAVMLAAAYGLYRATSREIAVARQQSDFISTVSHEFRTPLTSMRHLTELLASGSVPGEERKATYYQLLARETERLHRMVESLLSFGRMQAGAYAWKLEEADPRQLVAAAVEEFRREPQARGREVTCEADGDLPRIQADREALSRAVSNLLENAEKYSEPGTPIKVRARREGAAVRISVEDCGMGIPPEEQKQLFRKFVRGAGARRAGVRGIGVGLALVKSVAEAHGGTVELASEPGRGSTFALVIPWRAS